MSFRVAQDVYMVFDIARKQYEQFYNLPKDTTIKWINTESIESVLQQAQALKDRVLKQEGSKTETNQPETKETPAGDLGQKPLERGFTISFIDASGNKAKYRFSLMPAIESQFKVPPSVQVPEVKPGILIRTAMKHRNIVIPGGAPVVQTIGIESTIINMVGLFVGEGDGVVAQQEGELTATKTEDNAEEVTDAGTDVKPKKRKPALTAYQVADLFNSEVVQPGTKCLVEIVATAADEAFMVDKGSNPMQPYNNHVPFSEYRLGSSSKIEHIKLEVIITSIRLLAAQADRCYYSIDGYVVNYHQEARENPKVVLTVNGDVPVDDLITKQEKPRDNDHGLDLERLEQADAAPDIQRMVEEYRNLQKDLKAHQKELSELQKALDKDPSKFTPEQQRRYMELKTKIIPETKQKLNAKADEIREAQDRFAARLRSRPDYHRIIDNIMLEAQLKIPELRMTTEKGKRELEETKRELERIRAELDRIDSELKEARSKLERARSGPNKRPKEIEDLESAVWWAEKRRVNIVERLGDKRLLESQLEKIIRGSEAEIKRIEKGLNQYGINLDMVLIPNSKSLEESLTKIKGKGGGGNLPPGSQASVYTGADQVASVPPQLTDPYRPPTVPTAQGTEFVIRRNDLITLITR